MGGRPTKFSRFYKKLLAKKKSKKNGMFGGENDEATLLISHSGQDILESPSHVVSAYINDLNLMKRQMNDMMASLRTSIHQVENEHKKRLQKCIAKCKEVNDKAMLYPQTEKLKKVESQMEECRLRTALISEKFKNCVDYLDSYDALIQSVQRESRKEDTFLRRLLFKTAKRQYKKSQLNEAVETFCQLITATGGCLNQEEMRLLFEISKKKIAYTYDFYERITTAVKQIDDSGSKFMIDELWTSVIEDLRAECSDSFDIVMKVKADLEEDGLFVSKEQCNVESYKYLMATTICSLWLQITPCEHDEFEDIKDLFFDSLERYVDTFALNIDCDKNFCLLADLQHKLSDLLRQYPAISNSKRMKKMVQKISNLRRSSNEGVN